MDPLGESSPYLLTNRLQIQIDWNSPQWQQVKEFTYSRDGGLCRRCYHPVTLYDSSPHHIIPAEKIKIIALKSSLVSPDPTVKRAIALKVFRLLYYFPDALQTLCNDCHRQVEAEKRLEQPKTAALERFLAAIASEETDPLMEVS